MYKNIKVEGENLELILKNSHGDHTIIPANKRDWVKNRILLGKHSDIDEYVNTLPQLKDYAEDGTVIPGDPPSKKKPVIMEDIGNDTLVAPELDEVVIKDAAKPTVGRFFKMWGNNIPKAESFMGAIGQSIGAALSLPQAAATYIGSDGRETQPSKALKGTKFDQVMDAASNLPGGAGIVGSVLGSELGQDVVLDPLNIPIAKGIKAVLGGERVAGELLEHGDDLVRAMPDNIIGLTKEQQVGKIADQTENLAKQIDYNPSNNLIVKSIEDGSPLEKQLSKTGELNINNLQAHIARGETSKADKYILQKVVDSHFQNKTSINYNELKNKISDELVELNKTDLPRGNFENYGLDRIGFPNNTSASFTGKVPQHYQDIYNNINNSSTFYKGHDNKYWFDKLSMDKGFDTKEEAVKWLESQMAHNKQMNKTITFSNEEKFGRGSSDHFDENTLGHSRVFVSPEEPDVFHILESQSDFYQKSPLDKAQKNVKARQNILDEAINDVESKEIFGEDYDRLILDSHKMKLSEANYELKQAQKIMHDNPNPVQKILLGDKHQERLLQENLDYAAKNGQSKLRYPTPETAAKIQGYKKLQREVPIIGENELAPPPELIDMNTNTSYFNGNDYLPEHKTILKKYSEYPKMVKKTLGLNVKEVKDVKGNTWYELDIPESFKQGKGKIKALTTVGAIGTAAVNQIKE